MRVIAGRYRGSYLKAPDGLTTRPLTDRIKETLFNVLGARLAVPGLVPDIDVLDLFAGSGGLGIEALSRGARTCVFVERDRRSLRVLRDNLAGLRLGADVARVVAENVWTLRLPRAGGEGYGLIFIDPPFRDFESPVRVVDLVLRAAARLAPDGVLMLRHDVRYRFDAAQLTGLTCVDERVLGRSRILLMARGDGAVPGEQQGEEEPRAEDAGEDADGQLM